MIGSTMTASTRCAVGLEDRDEADVVLEEEREVLDPRHQEEQPPEAVDDAGHRGEDVDDRPEGLGQSPRQILAGEQRDPDGHGYGHDECQHRGHDGAVGDRRDAEARVAGVIRPELRRGEEVRLVRVQRRHRLGDEEGADRRDQHDHEDADTTRQPGEGLVRPPLRVLVPACQPTARAPRAHGDGARRQRGHLVPCHLDG